MLAAQEHQEMNGQVELTQKRLRTIAHSLMVHARVSEACIHFAFMYTTYHIFPVLPIKDLINEDGEPTTSFKLATSTKPSVSNLRVFCFPCVVRKATSHVDKQALNISTASKGYLLYVPITRNLISSYDVVFDERFSSALAYTSKKYPEAMDMRTEVTYTPCATSSKKQTGDIITFTQFEEGNLLSKTSNDAESGDKSDDNSIIPPLLSKEGMDARDYGDDSDDEPMSTEML